MNNEPIAWMCPTGLEYKQRETDFMYNDALYDTKLNWIPLYTHPEEHDLGIAEAIGFEKGYKAATAKTLTDEEIVSCIDESEPDTTDMIRFARAILKKAQEK